jgi:hypothetical protein
MTPLSNDTLLTTVLVGTLIPPDVPEGHMLRRWLDTWSGVGHIRTRQEARELPGVCVDSEVQGLLAVWIDKCSPGTGGPSGI